MQSRARWSLAASTVACLALATPRALAADPVAATPAPAANQASEATNDNDQAAAAFQRAVQQHAAGDLQGARDSMLESYRLSKRAELLYNIGKIQAALGECSLSLAAYRDYLEQVPEGRYRAEALQARSELEAQCPSADASALAVAPAASEVPAAAASPVAGEQLPLRAAPNGVNAGSKEDAATPGANRAAMVRWLGWSAIGAGALAGVGSIYFTAQAYEARGRFKDSADAAAQANDLDLLDESIQDEQHGHQRWAKILGVTSGVLVVGGTLTLLFGPRQPLPAGARVGLQVLPGSLGATYASTF